MGRDPSPYFTQSHSKQQQPILSNYSYRQNTGPILPRMHRSTPPVNEIHWRSLNSSDFFSYPSALDHSPLPIPSSERRGSRTYILQFSYIETNIHDIDLMDVIQNKNTHFTIMVRNLPNRYTKDALINFFSSVIPSMLLSERIIQRFIFISQLSN